MKKILFLLLCGIGFSCSSGKDDPITLEEIVVDPGSVILSREENPIGINLNYLRDPDILREAGSVSLKDALSSFNGKWLRYPGGEKSNYYRFALPPYEEVNPQTSGWYLTVKDKDVMDFDEYAELVKSLDVNAYVVVAYKREEITDQTTTLQEYKEHAVGWVRYAKEHSCNVKYWEIGNETWNNFDGSDWDDVVSDIAVIAKAMKEEDEAIKIGTSFSSREQLEKIVDGAGEWLDFVSCSNYYPGSDWGTIGYSYYEDNNGLDMIFLDETFSGVVQSKNSGLELVIAECNAKDWDDNWSGTNDLGHALVCFDLCGQINQSSDITSGMFWNTSWFGSENIAFNLLSNKNELRPNGQAIKLWNDYWKPDIVSTETVSGLITYVLENNSGELTIFIMNKDEENKTADIRINSNNSYYFNTGYQFSGTTGKNTDSDTETEKIQSISFTNNIASQVSFPSCSITLINLKQDN